MPKIIDHDAHRRELAERAATLFLRRGYGALGMREIAAALGVSKSALYHYFPSKQALFNAAGQLAVGRMADAFQPPPHGTNTPESRIEAVLAGVRAMAPGFGDELALLMDYLRASDRDGTAEGDRSLSEAQQVFLASVARIVGTDRAASVLTLCYGFLLTRLFAPDSAGWDRLAMDLRRLLTSDPGQSGQRSDPSKKAGA